MPFSRPTLTDLRNQVSQDIASSLPGSDPLLRFSNLNITGVAQADLANLHYGYLDWIAKQSNPLTATDEYLEGWAALKRVFRKPSTSARGSITFTTSGGAVIPAGARIVRGDGISGVIIGSPIISGNLITVMALIDVDPTGLTGAFGNAGLGSVITLSQAIAGIQSAGTVSVIFVGGADLEGDDSLRSRMLAAYQAPPQGGCAGDYQQWALSAPGITRAWCSPNSFGAGTVVIYSMFDLSELAFNGFPQGTNGVATNEPRATAATGDQLIVANIILPLQPVTALIYVVAPVAAPINFTISGIPLAKQALVNIAIAGVFILSGTALGGSIPIAFVWSAISAILGVSDFVITTPSADITNAAGTLPTVGIITYT